jgi:hypothetical protein
VRRHEEGAFHGRPDSEVRAPEFVPSEWIHAHGAWARRLVRTGLDGGTETTEQARLPWAFFAVWAIAFAVIVSHSYFTARPDLRQPTMTNGFITAAAGDDGSTWPKGPQGKEQPVRTVERKD